MKLNNAVLSQSLPGYALPQYDRQAMARRSRQQPTWLHFGAGNLFRAFPAVLAQRLLNAGETDTGVLCCEAYDTDAVTQFLRPYDDLTLSVSLLADGSMEKEVVGSIAQSLTLPQDRCRVEEIFRAPSLQMVSFTITEKGYAVNAAVKEDMGRAPGEAQTLLGALAACCLARFEACGAPPGLGVHGQLLPERGEAAGGLFRGAGRLESRRPRVPRSLRLGPGEAFFPLEHD